MLRCSCSLIVGSCVWKPGDRQANPTSCIDVPADGRELKGAGMDVLVVVKSSLLGRGREFEVIEGDEGGSFLTITFAFPILWNRMLVKTLMMNNNVLLTI